MNILKQVKSYFPQNKKAKNIINLVIDSAIIPEKFLNTDILKEDRKISFSVKCPGYTLDLKDYFIRVGHLSQILKIPELECKSTSMIIPPVTETSYKYYLAIFDKQNGKRIKVSDNDLKKYAFELISGRHINSK